MRISMYVLIAILVATGCATGGAGSLTSDRQGAAELRIDATALRGANITSVLVDTGPNTGALGLDFNPVSGVFEGRLALPTGPQTVRASAFSGARLVGMSTDISVDVRPGVMTRAVLRIVDLTQQTPVFGPLFDSLTYPTTVHASETATFTFSVIAPDHGLPTYQWSSDCADAVFASADAASTSWSKPTEGSCQIHVVATENEFSIEQNFAIVVLPEDLGVLDLTTEFVTGPVVRFDLDDGACSVFSGNDRDNSSCARTVAAPAFLGFSLNVIDWGLGTPQSFALADDCGGQFVTASQTSDVVRGTWTPSREGGVCILTAQAFNRDGAGTSLSIALLTRPAAE